jgi:outer membrane biosynthesis protein TonB
LTLTIATAKVEFPAFPPGKIFASSSSAQLQGLAQPRDEECCRDRVNNQASEKKVAPPEPPAPVPEQVEEFPKKGTAPRTARKKPAADGKKTAKVAPPRRAKGTTPLTKAKGSPAKASSGHGDDDSASSTKGTYQKSDRDPSVVAFRSG